MTDTSRFELTPEEIQNEIVKLGYDEVWKSNKEIGEACATKASRETLKSVVKWGNEECSALNHMNKTPRPRHLCPFCWQALQSLAEGVKE